MRVLSSGSVLLVLVATIGVFTFAKPQYRPPGGNGETLHFSEAKPPVNGWLFADATPGFHLGEHHNLWNTSAVLDRDVPAGAGIFVASRDAQGVRPEVLYWRSGCLVVQLHASRTRLCNPHAAAVIVADAIPVSHFRGLTNHNMFLIGVVRSDVTRVTVHARGEMQTVMYGSKRRSEPFPPQVVYDARTSGWWGSWEDSTNQPGPWDVTVKMYGRHGLIAATDVTSTRPGDAFYCASALRGVCGMSSAQRRS